MDRLELLLRVAEVVGQGQHLVNIGLDVVLEFTKHVPLEDALDTLVVELMYSLPRII